MTKRCPMCHAHISPEDTFCGKCGFNIGGKEEAPETEQKMPEARHAEEKQTYDYESGGIQTSLGSLFSNKKIIVALVVILIAAVVAGAFVTGKVHVQGIKLPSFSKGASANKNTTAKTPAAPKQNNTSNTTIVSPAPVENNTTNITAPVIPQIPPQEKLSDYLATHAPSIFPSFSGRIIEVTQDGNKTIIRFHVSTANPAQESLYLLGATFLAIPDAQIANATGYNADGKIITSPDSRTQATRAKYWRQYHSNTAWFGNVTIPPECTVDADCNDNNLCTKDQCLSSGFCSNVIVVTSVCPGLI